jgi:hypothetical protein
MDYLINFLCSLVMSRTAIAQEIPAQIEQAINALPIPQDYKVTIISLIGLFIAISFVLRGCADAFFYIAKFFHSENMNKISATFYALLSVLGKLFGWFGFSLPTEVKKKIASEKVCEENKELTK